MSTLFFSTSWLAGPDFIPRTQKYLDYYRPLKSILGFEHFFFADNASPWELIEPFHADDVTFFRFEVPLYKGGRTDEYPYCWRGFYTLKNLIMEGKWQKIIICDTDSFILSRKLADYIRTTNTGFYVMQGEQCGYPMSELSVLCEDAYPDVLRWMNARTWEARSAECKRFETEIPYSKVLVREFSGDRWGFDGARQQSPDMDFYLQARLETVFTFNERRG